MPKESLWAKWIFAAGLCFCLALQALLIGYPILEREVPLEPDDAYTYLLEPVRLAHTDGAQNRAFKTLYSQFHEIAETGKVHDRLADDARFRLFNVYHPLHSLALLLLKKMTGLEWEAVYGISQVAGLILIILGIGLWLRALWGETAAGIGLGILALSVLPGHGYYFVVPGNIALGLALLSWVPLLRGKRYGIAALVVGSMVVPFVHPLGRVYAIAAVFYLFLLDHGSRGQKKSVPRVCAW